MPAIEANIEGLWIAKQAAKGTPATAPSTNANAKRLRKVGGDVAPTPTHGNENYSDGNRFTDSVDFVDQINGGGAPVVQAGPGDLTYLLYLALGAESVGTAVSGVLPHTISANNAGGFWFTVWKKLGSSIVLRQQFTDCRMASLRVEGSSANKVVKATPTIVSLNPGVVFSADPTLVVEPDQPYLYTEATGTFTIDGSVVKGHSSFALVINDNIAPWFGDDVLPYDFVYGQGSIGVEGITLLVDAAGLAMYNKIVYGTATPTAGAVPQKSVYMGSYSFTLARGTGATARSLAITLPRVHWTPDVAVAGNPDGGPTELSLGAEARSLAGVQITVVSNTLDAAYV
jgi:hypothetical protein